MNDNLEIVQDEQTEIPESSSSAVDPELMGDDQPPIEPEQHSEIVQDEHIEEPTTAEATLKDLLTEILEDIQNDSPEDADSDESEIVFEDSEEIQQNDVYEWLIENYVPCNHTEYLEQITAPRPFLTTPFEEYTVVEGFCLLFFLSLVIGVIHYFLRRFL